MPSLTLQKENLVDVNTRAFVDWRLPENRIEAFSRVTHVRMVEGDCDHHHVARVIVDRMKLSDEDKALYCVLFGQSYRNHWAMIALQLDLYNMPEETLVTWHNANWHRMKFGNDTKWGIRRFPAFVKSLRDIIGSGSIYKHFYDAAHVGDTKENYYSLNKALREIWGMGRMTAWLAQQTFYELFDWDIDYWDQQLYDDGTWSQYDSICYLFDRVDIARKQITPEGKVIKYAPTKANIELMQEQTFVLMSEVNKRVPFHVDIYNVESVECEYRKTAYGPRIKEFTFWTSNELVEQFTELKRVWSDYKGPGSVDWSPYVIGFLTKGENVRNYGYDTSYFRVMVDYGYNLNTHYIYKDEVDAHKILNLPKVDPSGLKEMVTIWEDTIPKGNRNEVIQKYNPVNYLRFKSSEHPAWHLPNVDYSYHNGLQRSGIS
jgi:hypothetical protein